MVLDTKDDGRAWPWGVSGGGGVGGVQTRHKG